MRYSFFFIIVLFFTSFLSQTLESFEKLSLLSKRPFSFSEEYQVSVRPFDLIEEETNLLNLIRRVDPTIFNCSNPLDLTCRLLPIVCDLMGKSSNYEQICKVNHNQFTAQQFYEKAIRTYQAISCAGRGTFFAKVLNEYFNIPAFAINMGVPKTLESHVVTIVPIKIKEKKYKYFAFDAHNGSYLTDLEGNYIDLKPVFKGKPFINHFVQFDLKVIVDETFAEPPSSMCQFEKHIHEAKQVYSFPSLENFRSNLYPYKDCQWHECLLLRWLHLDERGGLLNGPSPKTEMGRGFYNLMDQFNIQIFSR